MSPGPLSRDPGVAKLVERQMRNWELARAQRAVPPTPPQKEVEEFIAVSRAVGAGGAGGADLAMMLGEKLGWPVFDKEILHAMADDDRIRTQVYGSMDERDLGWFEEAFRALAQSEFTKNDYFHRLTHTILALARQGHVIFRGRAADLILPADHGFRMRLTASPEACVAAYAEHHQIDRDQARKEVQRTETERAEFVRNHFGIDAAQQSRHDLIINLERFTPDQAIELILSALKMRGVVS
ncbi:MAG: cytidylate kinase-like family protein [Planctomycetota bacterium]|jgi:cytidylate kinase